MDSTFAFYSQIIDKMIDEKNYWRYYFLSPYCMDYGWEMDNYTRFNCGATRGCLISDSCDEVVKFAFDNGDECAKEAKIYRAAQTMKLDKYFVPCRFVGYYERDVYVAEDADAIMAQTNYSEDSDVWDNIEEENMVLRHIYLPLYAYTRIDDEDFENCRSDVSAEERIFVKDTHSPLAERSFAVAAAFLHECGKEEFYSLSDFCSEYKINDLHRGNVGYLDGHIVILDYAGYWR